MLALLEQGFMVLRALGDQFDHPAVKEKRLEADRPSVSLAQAQIDLNGGGQMDDWQARPPNAGFDIVRVGKPGTVENKLGQLIYREPLHARGELQYPAG